RLVEIHLARIDVRPVDIVPFDIAVEIPVVEAVVAIDVDIIAPWTVTAPNTPIIPIDDGSPNDARYEPGIIGSRRVVIGRIVVWIVGYRFRHIVRLIEHLRLVNWHIYLIRNGRLNHDVVVFLDDFRLLVALQYSFRHRLVPQLLDGFEKILLLIGYRIAQIFRPFKVIVHHLEDVRVIEQRDDAAVPILVRLKIGFG